MLIGGTQGFKCIGKYLSVEEALYCLKYQNPDVLLIDIGLPGNRRVKIDQQDMARSGRTYLPFARMSPAKGVPKGFPSIRSIGCENNISLAAARMTGLVPRLTENQAQSWFEWFEPESPNKSNTFGKVRPTLNGTGCQSLAPKTGLIALKLIFLTYEI